MSNAVQERTQNVGSRVPMSHLDFSVVASVLLGLIVVGVGIGFATGNSYFAFLMVGFPMITLFAFGIFDDRMGSSTRPTGGPQNAVLPIIALVVSCLGASVVGIALGHASRYLIRERGGEGEKIAFIGLIVGYSFLFVQAAFSLWLVTYFWQLVNVSR